MDKRKDKGGNEEDITRMNLIFIESHFNHICVRKLSFYDTTVYTIEGFRVEVTNS